MEAMVKSTNPEGSPSKSTGNRHKALADLAPPSLSAILEDTGWRIASQHPEKPVGPAHIADLVVELESEQGRAVLIVEAKANPNRADIEVLKQAAEYARALGERSAFVLFAPRIPSPLATRLRELRISYFDLSGACRLRAPGLFVERLPAEHTVLSPADYPNVRGFLDESAAGLPAKAILGIRPLKRHRVLRAMLSYPKRRWHQSELAQETDTDVSSHVHQVVKFLEREHYADHEGKGPNKLVFLTRPGDLLDDWSMHWRDSWSTAWRTADRYLSLGPNADVNHQTIADAAQELGARAAFTLTSGSEYYGSFLRDDVVCAYYQGNVSQLAKRCDLESVDRGANIIILPARDDGIFYLSAELRERLGGKVSPAAAPVCAVQLYLDMRAAGGRHAEQAGVLRQAEIGY